MFDINLNLMRIVNLQINTPILDFSIKDGIIYIIQHSNNVIHLISLEGKILKQINTNQDITSLHSPYYFCIDPWNNFIITDWEKHALKIVSNDGKLLRIINTKKEWGLMYPRGVTTTRSGKILLVFGGFQHPCFILI